MYQLWLRSEYKDGNNLLYTNNTKSYYCNTKRLLNKPINLSKGWNSGFEDITDRFLLIAEFTSIEELQKTNPELFI